MTKVARRPPIVFVHPEPERWAADLDGWPDPECLRGRFQRGVDCWIVRTACELGRRGYDVRIEKRAAPGALCVVHADDFVHRQWEPAAFHVVVRPDRGPVPCADLQIVQNPALARAGRRFPVPHWPEPGLIARDAQRGDRFERVAYFGQPHWLAASLRDGAFGSRLAALGLEFDVVTDRWWDYSNVDAVLAIRDARVELLRTKPATKLTNAWLAGCPAVLGPEPGYRALRSSDLDYLEAADADAAVAALRRLGADVELRRAMARRGRERAPAVTARAVADRWCELIEDVVIPRFLAFQRAGRARRAARVARVRRLWPLQRLRWHAFDLRTAQIGPRALYHGAELRSVKALAAARLAREEGPGAALRLLRGERQPAGGRVG